MSALAQAAYAAYGESTNWKNYWGHPMPQWSQLGEPIQAAWVAASDGVLRHWLENEFKNAVCDDERVLVKAGYMLKIGPEMGESPIHTIRVAIASFVIDLIAPKTIP